MLAEDIEYYSNHSLYCKFLGMRSSLQFLESWAQRTWALKGEMDIMLLANSYFMVTFNYLANRNKVFAGDPYFHNQVGLFIKPWHVGFIPLEEMPNHVPVWVCLLPFRWSVVGKILCSCFHRYWVSQLVLQCQP